jgi:hypothetical protein
MLESYKNFPANYLFCIFLLAMLSKEKRQPQGASPYIVQGVRRENDTHPGEAKRRVLCIVSMS